MSLLKIPAKYSGLGIRIKCLQCKYQLGNGKCHQNKYEAQSITKCEYKDKHRLCLLVCIPNGGTARRTKILETRDIEQALQEMKLFREELKAQGYHKAKQ